MESKDTIQKIARLLKESFDDYLDKKLESFQELMREEREVDKEDRLLTMSQAAEFLQISKQSLYKYRAQGKLKGFKRLGRRIFILQSDCMKSLEEYKI